MSIPDDELEDYMKRELDEIKEDWEGVPSKHLSQTQVMILKLLDKIETLKSDVEYLKNELEKLKGSS